MSIHDMVTYRDPATPGMAFGRPPTRPGYRRAGSAPSVDAGGAHVAAMAVDGVRSEATSAGPTAAHTPPVDPDATGAHAASDGATTAYPPPVDADVTEHIRRSDGADDSHAEADADVTEDIRRSDGADDSHAEADAVDPSGDDVLDAPRAEPEPEGAAAAAPEPGVALDPGEPTPAVTVDEAVALPADGDELEPLLGTARAADLRRRWGAVQAGFVDDPRRAVEVADDIVAEVVDALQAAVDDRRRAVAEPWRDDREASTDALLAAFHAYRAVFDRVLSA